MAQPLNVPARRNRTHAQGHDQPGGKQYIQDLPIDPGCHQHKYGKHDQPAIEQPGVAMEFLNGAAQIFLCPCRGCQPGRADEIGLAQCAARRVVQVQRKAGLGQYKCALRTGTGGCTQGLQSRTVPATDLGGVPGWKFDDQRALVGLCRAEGEPDRVLRPLGVEIVDQRSGLQRSPGLLQGQGCTAFGSIFKGLELDSRRTSSGVLVLPQGDCSNGDQCNPQGNQVDRQNPGEFVHGHACAGP